MARRWFTRYTGPGWGPKKGYNQFFATHIRDIRGHFDLKKIKPGIEVTTGTWRKYILQGRTVYVTVDKFTWQGYDDTPDGLTPILRLGIRMASQKSRRVSLVDKILGKSKEEEGLSVFYDEVLRIQFKSDYPRTPPIFRVEDPRYVRAGTSHEHHLWRGGWMCIFGNSGDWNSEKDTIISAVNVALDWIVLHYNKFGW